MLSTDNHGGFVAGVLLMAGFLKLVAKKNNNNRGKLTASDKFFILLISIFFIIQLGGVLYQPESFEYTTIREKLRALDYPARWLLLLPVYFVFRRYFLIWWMLPLGLSIGAILAAGLAHGQVYVQGIERATGASNHYIPFAELMVVVDLLLWAFSIYAWNKGNKAFSVFLLFASLAAFYGSLLSVTRGAWLAYVTILVVYICYSVTGRKSQPRSLVTKSLVIRSALFLLILLAVAQTEQYQVMQERTTDTVVRLSVGDLDGATSGRQRIFAHAIDNVKNYPFGIGTDNFSYQGKSHAHNELLNILVENGVQGLLAFLALMSFATFKFFQGLNKNKPLASLYATCGLILICSYAIFAMSQAVFSHNDTLMFFILLFYYFFGQQQVVALKEIPGKC